METYDDKDIKDVKWTNYKIVVPTEKDKNDLKEAFKHIHDSDIDTNNVPINQLAHEYLDDNNIIVNKELFDSLNNGK